LPFFDVAKKIKTVAIKNKKNSANMIFFRVADPDPTWIPSGQWIRIPEGKNDPQVLDVIF
jgi:hypothetical protein